MPLLYVAASDGNAPCHANFLRSHNAKIPEVAEWRRRVDKVTLLGRTFPGSCKGLLTR